MRWLHSGLAFVAVFDTLSTLGDGRYCSKFSFDCLETLPVCIFRHTRTPNCCAACQTCVTLCGCARIGAASCDQPRWLQHQDPGTDMSCLYDWARIAGLAADQLELGYGQAGRGAIAKSNISGKATVVSMPRQFALSVVAGQKCPMPELIPAKLWDKSDE